MFITRVLTEIQPCLVHLLCLMSLTKIREGLHICEEIIRVWIAIMMWNMKILIWTKFIKTLFDDITSVDPEFFFLAYVIDSQVCMPRNTNKDVHYTNICSRKIFLNPCLLYISALRAAITKYNRLRDWNSTHLFSYSSTD